MSQVNSIAGNDGFSRIRDVVGQVTTLNGVDITAVKLNAGTVKAETLTAQALSVVPRGVTLQTVDLVSNTDNLWWTFTTPSAMWDVETGANFRFTGACHIVSAEMSGVDLASAGAATLSCGPFATVTATTTTFTATLLADLGNDEVVFVQPAVTTSLFGTTGTAISLAAANNNYFVLTAGVANVTAGKVYVRLTYYVR